VRAQRRPNVGEINVPCAPRRSLLQTIGQILKLRRAAESVGGATVLKPGQ
jgi:hypothetical protein